MDLAAAIAILVRVFLVITMASIGMGLARGAAAAVAPLSLARLGVVNLVLVPLVAIAVCRALTLDPGVTVAILAMSVAPAGSLGPKLVQVARGDLALGVVATFALSALATLTVGPSLAVAGTLVGLDAATYTVNVPLVVGTLIVFQLAPLLVGVLLADRRPGLAAAAAPPLTRLSSLLLVLVVLLVLVDGWDEVAGLGPVALGAILVVIAASVGLGWLSGGRAQVGRRTSALLTAQRSGALALLVVAGPGAPVATATVVAFALVLLVIDASLAVAWRGAEARGWPRRLTA